jgi:hypothetical protein
VSSSDPTVVPGGPTPPRTQEIPVVQPATGATAAQRPPHPNATTPGPVEPVDTAVPTGPVDFVPGLPGLGTPPPPPPAQPAAPASDASTGAAAPGSSWPETLDSHDAAHDGPRKLRVRPPRDRAALVGLGLVALAVVLLELGLAIDAGTESYWSAIPLWSGFATLCAVLALVAFVPAGDRLRPDAAWRVAAGGLLGLAVFWVLVVLPDADTDRGFVLTAALAALGGALWVGARRKG